MSHLSKWLLSALLGVWLLHLLGVFVLETGFDAVWYHLPVVAKFVEAGRVYAIPEYYQSLNPLFSDLIFLVGYVVAGEFGAKIVAYVFGVGLAVATYMLSRQFLSRNWSLLCVLVVSSFQVVSWQSSSFYVDVAKAFWEIATIVILLVAKKERSKRQVMWVFIGGLLFGASLGTKLFSLLLLPAFLPYFWPKKWLAVFFLSANFLIAGPFYWRTYQHTGNPFYSFSVHTQKLGEIGGEQNQVRYLAQRTLSLPSSLTQLTLFSRDYTSVMFLVFLPLVVISWRELRRNSQLFFLVIFSVWQWLLWWYLPPTSVRYALSGFVTLVMVYLWVIRQYLKEKPEARPYILAAIAISVMINLLPRMAVAQRQLRYLSGQQTKREYLEQFFDGNIDQHLKRWHKL